jgi:hypothetical protein
LWHFSLKTSFTYWFVIQFLQAISCFSPLQHCALYCPVHQWQFRRWQSLRQTNEWKSASKKHKGTTRIPYKCHRSPLCPLGIVFTHGWKSPLTSWNNWHMHVSDQDGQALAGSPCPPLANQDGWTGAPCPLPTCTLGSLCPSNPLPIQSHIISTHTSLHTCPISSCNWYTTSQDPDEVKDIVHTQCPLVEIHK